MNEKGIVTEMPQAAGIVHHLVVDTSQVANAVVALLMPAEEGGLLE
jgi:hypothetical protein